MNLSNTKTKENLMKAFAGECQARMRYEFAASVARKEGFVVIENVFNFIAKQEIAHSKIFYKFLSDYSGESIKIKAEYPINFYSNTLDHLKSSYNNEMEEYDSLYKEFANTAKEEGFIKIYESFDKIANIEKTHADKFIKVYDKLKAGELFKGKQKMKWFCTNCGHIHEGYDAPESCPVCNHPIGYNIPFDNFF